MIARRWELLRALGAVAGDPADARKVLSALGLSPCDGPSHTDVFLLNCPPYASVYLGAEGGLGGDAADRVAGFWRAIGLNPPAEPDHLTTLLSLYATLGEAGAASDGDGEAGAEDRSSIRTVITNPIDERSFHARAALFWEHLWSWLPGYLGAVTDVGVPALSAWADLTMRTLIAERADPPPDTLPLALREAPPPLTGDENLGELLDALVAPVRSGMILTRRALADGAGQAGAGHRIGERRFTLRAMLEQEPERTLHWLADEAERWSARHSAPARPSSPAPADPAPPLADPAGPLADPAQQWWAARASATAAVLTAAVGRPVA
jgi:Nitrate reductase delta subunit